MVPCRRGRLGRSRASPEWGQSPAPCETGRSAAAEPNGRPTARSIRLLHDPSRAASGAGPAHARKPARSRSRTVNKRMVPTPVHGAAESGVSAAVSSPTRSASTSCRTCCASFLTCCMALRTRVPAALLPRSSAFTRSARVSSKSCTSSSKVCTDLTPSLCRVMPRHPGPPLQRSPSSTNEQIPIRPRADSEAVVFLQTPEPPGQASRSTPASRSDRAAARAPCPL